MISELSFIRTYNTFWKSIFPGGEDYIRLINSALSYEFSKNLHDETSAYRRALTNSISFELFNLLISGKLTTERLSKFTHRSKFLKELTESEIKLLPKGYKREYGNMLTKDEYLATIELSRRLYNQYSSKSKIIVKPTFPGCGIIFESVGDLYYKNTLVEVKAGDRAFSIQDLRQLYTYCALNHFHKKYDIKKLELCNPRRGVIWWENIDIVSESIAGATTVEIYNEIITFISSDYRSI